MLGRVEGVQVGHWSDVEARTGCTVVLLPDGTVASGEVRGGAPATRDFALLEPYATVEQIDAVVLSGGSVFGLSAADGVLGWLEEHDRGIETPGGKVPIVVGLSLFDLAVGDGSVRPSAVQGRTAAEAATAETACSGRIGAGSGATVSKWRGPEHLIDSGIGCAVEEHDGLVVGAMIAVNAWGDVTGDESSEPDDVVPADPFTNTTIGVIVTNAVMDKTDCQRLARAGHAGLSRAIFPAHSPFDGDALVVAATGSNDTDWEPRTLVPMTNRVTAAAIRDALN
jgi:L-aminopeptidase/D-esterase-like protein